MRKKRNTSNSKSLAKGLLAGLVGGLAAVVVKSVADRFYPPLPGGEQHSDPDPGALPAEAVTDHELALASRNGITKAEWAEGALTGAVYGAVTEIYPAA